jgi:hypothetical protein
MMEMGLHSDSGSVRAISKEQSKYFREKFLKDKDSGSLRKEILEARKKAVAMNANKEWAEKDLDD